MGCPAGKLIELEYASIEDRKIRSQLRSAPDLEVKVRARQQWRHGLCPANERGIGPDRGSVSLRRWRSLRREMRTRSGLVPTTGTYVWRQASPPADPSPISLHPPGPRSAQVTALQIAALKRLSRGSRLLVLDRNGGGGGAKAVARALAERGFGRVYVIKGGFQGWQVRRAGGSGLGWVGGLRTAGASQGGVQGGLLTCLLSLTPLPLLLPCHRQASKLRVKPASSVSRVEVLPPGTFGTGSTRPTVTPSRQLPAGSRGTGGSGRTLPATASTVSGRRALPSSTGTQ